MIFWVHTLGIYRAKLILGRVHTAFFNCYLFNKMTHMPDEIVLARIMTALDLELVKDLHYHDKGYESDNDYGLPAQVMWPVIFIQSQALRPPSTLQTTREHNVPSLASCQDDPGMSCLSIKESTDT